MDQNRQRVRSGVGAMICRTAIVCFLLLSGQNAEPLAPTESLQSAQTTTFLSSTFHLESPSPITEIVNTEPVLVSAISTVVSQESSHITTDVSSQSAISNVNSTTTEFSPTTMKLDSTDSDLTTAKDQTNTTNPNSLTTATNLPDISTASSTPAPLSGGSLTSSSVENLSGPIESSTEPTKVNQSVTMVTMTSGVNTKDSTNTSNVDVILSSNPSTQGTTQMSSTQSTLVKSDTVTGSTDTTSPVNKVPDSTEKETRTDTDTTEINTENKKALSTGSVAAITVIVIVLVLLIFGGAAFWKIRHSSYGRLLEDQDYGSLGNYNNPLYDDS